MMKNKTVNKELMAKTLRWFGSGQVGLSSQFMAVYLTTGSNEGIRVAYPHDPDDLNRCLLLLEAVPELREHMHKLSKVCDQWSQLVENWDALESCFLNEVGLNWCKGKRARITYKAMKEMGC